MGTKERPSLSPDEHGPRDAGQQGKAKRVRGHAKTSEPGRKAKVETQQARFLNPRMKQQKISRKELARLADVSPATISRYLNEEIPIASPEFHELICDILFPSDFATRRAYMEGIWGLPVRRITQAPPVHSFAHTDLDRDVDALEQSMEDRTRLSELALNADIDRLRRRKKPEELLPEVQEIYDRLKHLPLDDPRVAEVRLRTGLFLAALQEVSLPWQGAELKGAQPQRPEKTRAGRALATYNELRRDVFRAIGPARVADAFLQVLVRTIVLKREGKEGEAAMTCVADLQHPQWERFINYLITKARYPRSIVAYKCQLLHTLAVAGKLGEWLPELEKVRKFVRNELRVQGSEGEELDAIVTYTEGVGYKRFMWLLRDSPLDTSRHWAQQSVDVLTSLMAKPETVRSVYNINLYHPGLPRVLAEDELLASILDSRLWTDPSGALALALSAHKRVERSYPSLASKLEAQIALAEQLQHA